jgi:hypothetical protein
MNALAAEVDRKAFEVCAVEDEGDFGEAVEVRPLLEDEVEVVVDGARTDPLGAALCSLLAECHKISLHTITRNDLIFLPK